MSENNEKISFFLDSLEKGLSFCLKVKSYKEALEILSLSKPIYLREGLASKTYRCNLYEVLIGLVRNDLIQARNCFSESLKGGYLTTIECEVSEGLIQAFEKREIDTWKKLLRQPVIEHLDRNLTKAAIEIAFPEPEALLDSPNFESASQNNQNVTDDLDFLR